MGKRRWMGIGCGGVMGLIGIILIVIGTVIPNLIDEKIRQGLQENLELKKDSIAYNLWLNNTAKDSQPQFQKFFFFNVTNYHKVLLGQEKPMLQQVGPYVYRKWIVKYNVTFSQDGNQVQFKTYTYFTFDANQTIGNPLRDMITTVNLPFQGVQSKLGYEWWETLIAESLAGVTNSSPFIQKTVQELIWGFNSTLIQFLDDNLNLGIDPLTLLQQNQTSLNDSYQKVKYDTIKTGASNLNDVLQYVKYQEIETMSFWGSDKANQISGTDGTMFPPDLKVGDRVAPWVDVAWRTLVMKGVENVNQKGLNLLRLELDETDFDNSTTFPSNAAYWQYGPRGVGNLTTVFQGTPIFLSAPHFLNADPFYLKQVDGLSPNKSAHETTLDIDPVTGITLSVQKRLQIVCKMSPSLISYPSFKPPYLPIMWIELSSQLTKETADQISNSNGQIESAKSAKRVAKYGGLIAGSILLTGSLILLAVIGRKIIQERSSGYSTIQ